MDYPVVEHLGASAWVAQASFHSGSLYHAVLIGHATALKAIRAGLSMKRTLYLPSKNQLVSASNYARLYGRGNRRRSSSKTEYSHTKRINEVIYGSRIVGEPERGLYLLACWADNRDLLAKASCFYIVDPRGEPVPIQEYEYHRRTRDPLPTPPAAIMSRFLAWLDEALLLPLRPEWGPHLWEKGSLTTPYSPLVRPLLSVGCAGWLVQTNESKWTEIVQAHLRQEG